MSKLAAQVHSVRRALSLLWNLARHTNLSQEMLERNGHTPLDSVGERAVRVSRGEARTIAFARAIARRPPSVLLIDEAGSALDREAERALCAYLERHRSAHACVIASHHDRVLGMADRVITMKDGKIVDGRRT